MRMLKAAIVFLICAGFLSCGRYGPPNPPENLAPKAVSDLSARSTAESIVLSWNSPDRDLRGKELKTLDGYSILRVKEKDIKGSASLSESMSDLALVEDHNIEDLELRRKEAREKGELLRRVKIPAEKKVFSYEDKDLILGETYLYRVIPLNQGGIKGTPSSLVKVLFKGEESDIFMTADEESLAQGLQESPFGPESVQGQAGGFLNVGR